MTDFLISGHYPKTENLKETEKQLLKKQAK